MGCKFVNPLFLLLWKTRLAVGSLKVWPHRQNQLILVWSYCFKIFWCKVQISGKVSFWKTSPSSIHAATNHERYCRQAGE